MPFRVQDASYWNEMSKLLNVNPNQMKTLQENGFVVLGNVHANCFGNAYKMIYQHHLPVFITTDSILHALHCSFDEILKEVEVSYISPELEEQINSMMRYINQQDNNTSVISEKNDALVFLTVAKSLLKGEKISKDHNVNYYLNLINGLNMTELVFFGDKRSMDFSQFIPRGHYTKSNELKKYFRAMMWLGRAYMNFDNKRNAMLAVYIADLIKKSNCQQQYDEINGVLNLFIGTTDSLDAKRLNEYLTKNSIDIKKMADDDYHRKIVNAMKKDKLGLPKIEGEAVNQGTGNKELFIKSPQFCFMGQRYTVDSEILETTAWYPERPMPNAVDIAFTLGSSAAVEILRKDIDAYGLKLTEKLEKSREILNSTPRELYDNTLYHGWLRSLSTLFPDDKTADNKHIPEFMKTKAWEFCKLNTFLGSYAQLKHDTILYSKPSYQDGACFFPSGYIEPNPLFFNEMKKLGKKATDVLGTMKTKNRQLKNGWVSYFDVFSNICGLLEKMAQKETSQEPFTDDENRFIKQTLSVVYDEFGGCGPSITYLDGWYYRLFYNRDNATEFKAEIADIANYPFGNKALYLATAMVNYGIFAVKCDGSLQLFIGPTYQCYQFTWPMTDRLTDERWESLYGDEYKEKVMEWTTPYLVSGVKPLFLEQPEKTSKEDDVFIGPEETDYQGKIASVMKKANEYKVFMDKMIGMESAASRPGEPGLIKPLLVTASQDNVFSMDTVTGMKYYHGTYCLFDNDPGTAWVSDKNSGIGAWVMVFLESEKKIYKIKMTGGWDYIHPKYGDLYRTNSRLKKIKLTLFRNDKEPVFESMLDFDGSEGAKEFTIPNVKTTRIIIEVVELIPGSKYRPEACISEMSIYGK